MPTTAGPLPLLLHPGHHRDRPTGALPPRHPRHAGCRIGEAATPCIHICACTLRRQAGFRRRATGAGDAGDAEDNAHRIRVNVVGQDGKIASGHRRPRSSRAFLEFPQGKLPPPRGRGQLCEHPLPVISRGTQCAHPTATGFVGCARCTGAIRVVIVPSHHAVNTTAGVDHTGMAGLLPPELTHPLCHRVIVDGLGVRLRLIDGLLRLPTTDGILAGITRTHLGTQLLQT